MNERVQILCRYHIVWSAWRGIYSHRRSPRSCSVGRSFGSVIHEIWIIIIIYENDEIFRTPPRDTCASDMPVSWDLCLCAIVSTEWNERKICIRMIMDKFVTMTKLLCGRTNSFELKKVQTENSKKNHFVREEIEGSNSVREFITCYYRIDSDFPFLWKFFFSLLRSATFSSMPLNNGCDEIWMGKRFLFAHAHGKMCILCSKSYAIRKMFVR